jgi:hypothetical protein
LPPSKATPQPKAGLSSTSFSGGGSSTFSISMAEIRDQEKSHFSAAHLVEILITGLAEGTFIYLVSEKN